MPYPLIHIQTCIDPAHIWVYLVLIEVDLVPFEVDPASDLVDHVLTTSLYLDIVFMFTYR